MLESRGERPARCLLGAARGAWSVSASTQLDLDTAELRDHRNTSTLLGQPLQILTALLERPGELVTREELKKKLWPDDTFVDFDQSLNKAVNRLRQTLNDSAEHPRFIETLPRRGYRFIGSVAPARTDDDSPPSPWQPQPSTPERARNIFRLKPLEWAAAGLVLGAIALGTSVQFRRPAVPHVVATVRLTYDGARKYSLVTDGVRLCFRARNCFQASVDGGETTQVATGLKDVETLTFPNTDPSSLWRRARKLRQALSARSGPYLCPREALIDSARSRRFGRPGRVTAGTSPTRPMTGCIWRQRWNRDSKADRCPWKPLEAAVFSRWRRNPV